MHWYDFLIGQAVSIILMVLQGVVKNPASKEELRTQMYNIYFAIQRAYPELAPQSPPVEPK